MGYIGNIMAVVTVFTVIIAILTATPDRVCVNPLACFLANTLFGIKKVLIFSVALFLLYGYIVAVIFLFFRTLRFVSGYPFVRDFIDFSVTMSERSFQKMVTALSNR